MALVALLGLLALPVAHVDDRAITRSDLDAASAGRTEALHGQLARLVEETTWRVIDARLPPPEVSLQAPSAAEVAARRAQVGDGLDPSVVDEAVRWQIEKERREVALVEARRELHEAAAARVELPATAQLDRILPPALTVGWVGDEPIPAADVERAAALALYRLRGELHRERERSLERIIEERLLTDEAARRGVAVTGLLPLVAVSEGDIRRYVESRTVEGAKRPDPERVRPLLESRARHEARADLLASLRKNANIEVFLEAPAVPRFAVPEAAAPALGPEEAPPTRQIVAFVNYRDSGARLVHAELDRVLEVRPEVRIVLRDFVPGFDPTAQGAALLGRCADAAGVFAAWRGHALARTPPRAYGAALFDESALARFAQEAQVDVPTLKTCVSDPATAAAIDRDTAVATRLGFSTAPALVVAGRPLTGVQSAGTILAVLDEAESRSD
ncbi:MAG: thioredoxin domain-containing protein [Candidatus Binatia bacterium]|nr:thioredoxin domain-containing protein [Candidatus Binatia bacterium]